MARSLAGSIRLSVVVLLVVGSLVGPPQAFATSRSPVREQAPLADEWPQPGYSPAQTRFNPAETTIDPSNAGTLVERWEVGVGPGFASDPVVADGRVFVSSFRHLTTFDAKTGQQLWTIRLGAHGLSTPSVDGGYVYVTASQSVFAFDAATGVEVWQANLNAGQLFWPVIVDAGIALTFQQPGNVVALDAATGTALWRSSAVAPFYKLSTDSGLVYLIDGYEVVVALDLGTGAEVWRHEPTARHRPIYTGVSIQEGVGYAASTEKLFAFDSATGTSLFDGGSEGGEDRVLAVATDVVLLGTSLHWLGRVGGFDAASGVPLWGMEVNSNVNAIGAANRVAFVSAGTDLYAFDTATGTLLLTIPFSRTAPGAPVITGGMVYVTTSHLLHAYGLPGD